MVERFSNWSLSTLVTAILFGGGAPLAAASGESTWSSFEDADRVYHETIRAGVTIEDRVAGLKDNTEGSALVHAHRLYLASLLQWRHGYREAALSSVDDALAMDRHGALLHQRGRLLEALNRIDEAIEAYREALPLLSGSSRVDTELRMALLIASERGEIGPLLTLAEGSDVAVRNRVAMVLAVLGHAGEAARLYRLPAGASAERQWRQALRLTEWRLWADEPVEAREAAWRAVDLAANEQDRRYAVALLTEAYRKAEALPALVEALEGGRDVGGDTRALWVRLLREIDRPDDALAALEGSAEHEPLAVKRQFVGIYGESGRSDEMVAALERLMTVDPDEVIWAQGLAEFYLERGERSEAEAAWRGFVERAEAAAALLDGAAVILKLGFDELALAAAEKAQRQTVLNRAGRDAALDPAARFQFELYLERGRWDEAREVLQSLEAATAASDPMRKSIAMAYERLNRPAEALRVMTALVEARDGSYREADVEASQYLAQLLLVNGDAPGAVALLLATLPDAGASQLRLLHTRLIAAAQAAGIEDELVVDLTAKLNDSRATEQEIQLLIEMRIRAREEAEALALIDTLYGNAGADSVEKLQQVAVLHRSFGNWQTYDDTLAQLVEQDAANAVFHVRSRIINYIDRLRFEAEDDQEVSDTLIALLEQYLAVSEVGADREFVAGVLALGGQHQNAIRIYREILAVDSNRVDSYLEIGNQLALLQRGRQAVGMYQYLLESGNTEEISWVALDGILNLQPDRATLEWAQRMALLRLSAFPERFEYYRQLADLSSDLGNGEFQLAALYNGLAAEPELRLTTLRELLRITDGANPATATVSLNTNQNTNIAALFQGSNIALSGLPLGNTAGTGDDALWQERHIDFCRRLLALGLSLPPEVHLSLGKAMIEVGDTDAALRAMKQAVEQTGSDELVAQAADIFGQAGDDLTALRLYEQALRNDPDSLDLLVDAAWVNERLGSRARAGELFLQGLTMLLALQPPRSEAILFDPGLAHQARFPDDEEQLNEVLRVEGKELFPYFTRNRTQSLEYRTYYEPLRNGLVRTLLDDRQSRDTVLSRLWNDYESTLAPVHAWQSFEADSNQFPPRPSLLPRLANYPRLRLQAQLMRYLAYTFRDYAAVNDMDETLLTLFPEDRQLPEILVSHRAEWGSPGYLHWLQNDAALTGSQKETLAHHWLELGSDIAESLLPVRVTSQEAMPLSAEDSLEDSLQKALDRALRSGDAVETVRLIRQLAATERIWETLDEAAPYLSAADKRTVAEHIIGIVRDDSHQAMIGLSVDRTTVSLHERNGDPQTWPRSWVARLESWSGESVFDEEQLLALANTPPERRTGDWDSRVFDVWYIYNSLSAANRVEWIAGLLRMSDPVTGYRSLLPTYLIRPLLQVERDDASAEILRMIIRDSESSAPNAPDWLALETIDIHPTNIQLARELESLARKKYPAFAKIYPDPTVFEPNYLRSEGKIGQALHKLVDVYFDGKLPFSGNVQMLHRVRRDETASTDDIAFIQAYYRLLVAGNESVLIDLLNSRSLSSAEDIRRRNRLLLRLYYHLHEDDPQKYLNSYLDLLETDPGNPELVRVVSNLSAWNGERFVAQKLRRTQLENAVSFQTEASQGLQFVLPALLQGALELDHPVDAVLYGNALGWEQTVSESEPGALTDEQPLDASDAMVRALKREDVTQLRRAAGILWQRLQFTESGNWVKTNYAGVIPFREIAGVPMFRRRELAGESLPGAGHGDSMLPALARQAAGVEILENWTATVRGRMQEQAQPMIDALADAYVDNGTAARRFAELSSAIREQRAGDKELGLWMAIGSRVPELAVSDEADTALASYLSSETTYRPSLLFGLTRFLALRGDADGALQGFESLIRWVRGRVPVTAQSDMGIDVSIHDVLASAREVLDTPTYQRLLREVLDQIKPNEEHLLPLYSEFVLVQFDAADDRRAFYRVFEADVDAAMQTLRGTYFGDVFDAAFVAATAVWQYWRGDTQAALDGLGQAMEASVASQLRLAAGGLHFSSTDTGAVERYQESKLRYRRMLGREAMLFSSRLMQKIVPNVLLNGDLPGAFFSEVDLGGLQSAYGTFLGRVEAGDMDRSLGIEILLGLVRAYREHGLDAEAQRVFADVAAQPGIRDLMPRTAGAVVSIATELGKKFDDAGLEKELLLKGAIEPGHMAAVLRRIAAAEGDAAALEAGSKLLEFTLNDALMDELIELADANGNPAHADEWRALQSEARVARAELERTAALPRLF